MGENIRSQPVPKTYASHTHATPGQLLLPTIMKQNSPKEYPTGAFANLHPQELW